MNRSRGACTNLIPLILPVRRIYSDVKILAKLLKPAIKTLAMSGSEHIMWDVPAGVLVSIGPDFTVVLVNPAFADANGPTIGLNSRQTSSAANRLSGEVEISFELVTLVVKSARTSFELPTVKYEAPKIENIDAPAKLPLAELKSVLAYASTATDTKQKFAFQGAIWFGDNKAVASTGQRLAVIDTSFHLDMLFPATAVSAVRELDGEEVWIGQSDVSVFASVGDDKISTTIIARKLAREFPTWRNAIPAEFKFEGIVKAEEAKQVLLNVAPLGSKIDTPKLSLAFSADSIVMKSVSDGATAEDSLPFRLVAPDGVLEEFRGVQTRINYTHLVGFLESVSGDVIVKGGDSRSPLWFECGAKKLLVATTK